MSGGIRTWRTMRVTACVVVSLAPHPGFAAGDERGSEKEQCIAASERGQDRRDASAFRAAREAFVRCARDTCPARLRGDCGQWLLELDAKYPSVVVAARDEVGKDLEAVTVYVDGEQLATRLDGKPLRLDPGRHRVRCEANGFAPVEDDVIIRTGEKDRPLVETFHRFVPAPLGLVHPASPPASIGPRTLGWTLAGTAALAFATEAVFGGWGLSERASAFAPGGCAPHCSAARIQDINTKFITADASLGVGVLSTGLALFFLLRPDARRSAGGATIQVDPRQGGAVATIGATFQ